MFHVVQLLLENSQLFPVYRMELTNDDIMVKLNKKYTSATSIGYTLTPGIYEITDLRLILKSLLAVDVKVDITMMILD